MVFLYVIIGVVAVWLVTAALLLRVLRYAARSNARAQIVPRDAERPTGRHRHAA